jgi:hypothetical protein
VAPQWLQMWLPYPDFYFSADPDPDPGSQINPDPDPGQTLSSQKVFFSHQNIFYCR